MSVENDNNKNLDLNSKNLNKQSSKATLRVVAGDQRFNSIHWLAGLNKLQLSEYLKSAGVEYDDKVLELVIMLHNDLLGVAKGNDKKNLELTGDSFLLLNNNCESQSWMAAYQWDCLFRHDLSNSLASLYEFDPGDASELITTDYSWGLIPHPNYASISTDSLPVNTFPEIYGYSDNGKVNGAIGNKLIRKVFAQTARLSAGNTADVRNRLEKLINSANEFLSKKNGKATHAELMNHLLLTVFDQFQDAKLTSTFDEACFENLLKSDFLSKILQRWLSSYDQEFKNYNKAMGQNIEKHKLSEGEYPFWVSMPSKDRLNGQTAWKRYTLFLPSQNEIKLKNGNEEYTIKTLDNEPISDIEKLTKIISEGMNLDLKKVAIIPKAHVLICELGTGSNFLVQPLKPAAYAKEANLYGEKLGMPTNNLFLKVNVWNALREENVRLPKEIAAIIGKKNATGEEIANLEQELNDPNINKFLTIIAPILISLFGKIKDDNIEIMGFNKHLLPLLEELGIVSENQYRLNNTSIIFNAEPEIQSLFNQRKSLHEEKRKKNGEKNLKSSENLLDIELSEINSKLKSEKNLLFKVPFFQDLIAYLRENFQIDIDLNQVLDQGIDYVLNLLIDYFEKAISANCNLQFVSRYFSLIQENLRKNEVTLNNLLNCLESEKENLEKRKNMLQSQLEEAKKNQEELLKKHCEETKNLKTQLGVLKNNQNVRKYLELKSSIEKTSEEQTKIQLKNQVDALLATSLECQAYLEIQKKLDTLQELIFGPHKKISSELRGISENNNLTTKITKLKNERKNLIKELVHNLLKTHYMLKYSSYYADPISIYLAFGDKVVEKFLQNLQLSKNSFI